jgi:hypothetical protein
MYAVAVLPGWSFFLRPTRETLIKFALGALVLIAMSLMWSMNPPHDPDECRYVDTPHIDLRDMPIPLPGDFRMAQVVSPTTANPFGRCPGGHQFSVGGGQ